MVTAGLEHEHRLIEQVVAGMAFLADDLEQGKAVDAQTLADVLEFLRVYADRLHHGKEEEHLFPALEANGVPGTGCPIGALKREHEKGRTLVAEFDDAIHRYASGKPDSAGPLATAMNALVAFYPAHIWKEDYLLFPLAERVLPEREQRALSEGFERVEAGIGDVQQRFEQLAARLAGKAAPGRQRTPTATSAPSLAFDLPAEIAALRNEEAWSDGRNAKTLVKEPDLRVVLTAIRAGERIHEHQAAATISIQTIEGRVRVHASEQAFDLPAGRLLSLERNVAHDVEALEDSAFLLTLGWRAPAVP